MLNQTSENLQAITKKVLDQTVTGINKISVVLYSPNDESKTIELEDFGIIIEQDFVSSYTDHIRINFYLRYDEYRSIIEVYRDLRCNIVILPDSEADDKFEYTDPVTIDGKIIFSNKDDIYKRFHSSVVRSADSEDDYVENEQVTANRIPITADVIDDDLFEARKKQMSFILHDTTLGKALHYIVGRYNPTKKCIIEPDNDTEYTNIAIPQMQTFSEVFKYLDRNFDGIYYTGLGYYWSNKTMYVYPLFNNNPDVSPYFVHIYFLGENNLAGQQISHIEIDGDYHIVSAGKVNSKQLTEQGTENVGNGFIIQDHRKMFNNWIEQEETEFYTISDGLIRMQLDTENTLSETSHNVKFMFGKENISDCRTSLSSIQGTLTSITWDHAVPFIIKPGWKLVYHYDGDGEYVTKNASCLKARYEYVNVGRRGMDRLYTCKGRIALFTEN